MKLDVLGLIGACSYALDCVEAELVHVTNKHAKRVAYMSVCTAMQMGITGRKLQDLAVCALLHDNALTQYIQEEFHNDISHVDSIKELPHAGAHCVMGEQNIKDIPFYTDVKNGTRFRFLHELYICVTCLIWYVCVRRLTLRHGRK